MNLSKQLQQTASSLPQKIAFYFSDQATSYQQLDSAVTKFASGLEQLGIKKGDHVALLLGNSPHFIIGLYGALRIGATVIPINPIYTADEITFIIQNGDVKAVIAVDQLLPLFDKISPLLSNVDHYIICDTPKELDILHQYENSHVNPKLKSFSNVLENGNLHFIEPDLKADDVAVILYTSGTTGKPKGAMLTHQNLYSNAKDTSDYLKMSESDRVITVLPMFHVFCLTVTLNAPLINGATLLIIPRFSPKEVFQVTKKYEATVFAGVPTMYNFLLQYSEGNPSDLNSLRLCISGGASMPVALLKNFEKNFNVIISEGYGLSEASPVACFNPLDRPRKPGSIGTSILNVENKVVNELGEEVPIGEVGELIIRGPNVMKGYYKLPEDSKNAIRDGWLYTGDLAKMDEEGYFYIVDRKKDMIIVGGFNVYPREIEEVLYNHPKIVEVAVVGILDANVGETVKCFVVSKDPKLTENELLTFCREHLAKYKVPSTIEFLEELPKNTTGKILRRSLKAKLLENMN